MMRIEYLDAGVRIIFPEYRETPRVVRGLLILLSPIIFGPFVLLIPIAYALRRLGLVAPPPEHTRRHFEVEVSGNLLTFRHWFGEEVWSTDDVRDVFTAEAGGDGSEYQAIFCSVAGSPVRVSKSVRGFDYLDAQNGRRQITYDLLSDSELATLTDTLTSALGLTSGNLATTAIR